MACAFLMWAPRLGRAVQLPLAHEEDESLSGSSSLLSPPETREAPVAQPSVSHTYADHQAPPSAGLTSFRCISQPPTLPCPAAVPPPPPFSLCPSISPPRCSQPLPCSELPRCPTQWHSRPSRPLWTQPSSQLFSLGQQPACVSYTPRASPRVHSALILTHPFTLNSGGISSRKPSQAPLPSQAGLRISLLGRPECN